MNQEHRILVSQTDLTPCCSTQLARLATEAAAGSSLTSQGYASPSASRTVCSFPLNNIPGGGGFFFLPLTRGPTHLVFAGKDASRALAQSSLKPEDCRPDWEDLADEHKKVLDDWFTFFSKRYNIRGKVASS